MEKLLFLDNKVRRCIICPLKSIICINILAFNTRQSHMLTFTVQLYHQWQDLWIPEWNLCTYIVFVPQ